MHQSTASTAVTSRHVNELLISFDVISKVSVPSKKYEVENTGAKNRAAREDPRCTGDKKKSNKNNTTDPRKAKFTIRKKSEVSPDFPSQKDQWSQ